MIGKYKITHLLLNLFKYSLGTFLLEMLFKQSSNCSIKFLVTSGALVLNLFKLVTDFFENLILNIYSYYTIIIFLYSCMAYFPHKDFFATHRYRNNFSTLLVPKSKSMTNYYVLSRSNKIFSMFLI
jgi:hypothetical protein